MGRGEDPPPFTDRRSAGRRLAGALREHVEPGAVPLVLALPRGGVPVAAPVAEALGADLDVLVVRKLGMPGHEELAMGAIASGGALVENPDVAVHVPPAERAAVLAREREELDRRERALRGDRPPPRVAGREIVLVDDGLATGATMRAAVAAVRALGAARTVVAVPVAPVQTCARLREEADDVVCLTCPHPFHAVGQAYEDFAPPRDRELQRLLAGG